MRWTKKLPTEEGWYWRAWIDQDGNTSGVACVKVFRYLGIQYRPGKFKHGRCCDLWELATEYRGAMAVRLLNCFWSPEPITPPNEMEEV